MNKGPYNHLDNFMFLRENSTTNISLWYNGVDSYDIITDRWFRLDYIEGYKVFNGEFKTFNGMQFKEHAVMHVDGDVKAGPCGGRGFHLCLNFEDTFRFTEDNPILCEVIGFGVISPEYKDEYYGYFDIYACSDIYIKRIIPREEIIEMAKELPEDRLERFIQTYKMTDGEINQIMSNLNRKLKVLKAVRYYHFGDKEAYMRSENDGWNYCKRCERK